MSISFNVRYENGSIVEMMGRGGRVRSKKIRRGT